MLCCAVLCSWSAGWRWNDQRGILHSQHFRGAPVKVWSRNSGHCSSGGAGCGMRLPHVSWHGEHSGLWAWAVSVSRRRRKSATECRVPCVSCSRVCRVQCMSVVRCVIILCACHGIVFVVAKCVSFSSMCHAPVFVVLQCVIVWYVILQCLPYSSVCGACVWARRAHAHGPVHGGADYKTVQMELFCVIPREWHYRESNGRPSFTQDL